MDTGRVDDRKLTSLSPPNGGLSVNDASEDGVGRRQAPVLTHLLLLSSIFVPLVLLPYIPIRRHLLSLHRKLDDLAATTSSLRSELKVSQLEVALRRQEHLRLRDRLITTKREIESLTLETARHSKDRAAVDDEFRKSIRELLNERDQTRRVSFTIPITTSELMPCRLNKSTARCSERSRPVFGRCCSVHARDGFAARICNAE